MGAARETVERWVELYNNGAIDELITMYGPDAVLVIPMGTVRGQGAIDDRLRGEHAAFSEAKVTARTWVEDGDTVAVRYSFTARHTGPIPSPDGSDLVPGTGEQITFEGFALYQMRDGKIVANYRYFDQLPIALHLGLVALTEPPATSDL